MMNLDTLTFQVTMETNVAPQATRTAKALGDLSEAARLGQQRFAALGATAGQTRAAMAQLPAQFTDIATSLAGGQNPLLVLIQQGGQIKDSFGGVGNALRAVSTVVTPLRLALGGVAAAFAATGLAAYQGEAESREFARNLQLTGNFAGQTLSSFNALAYGVSQSSGVTIGAAREIVSALVATGTVGPRAIGSVTAAAATLARITDASAESIAKDFAGMSSGVAKWAAEHNRSYNYLNVEQFKYIRQLEAQGRAEEAMRVNADLLDKALKDRAADLGLLQSSWKWVKETASEAWDAMLNIGRTSSSGDVIATLRQQLAQQEEALSFAKDGRGSQSEIQGRERVIAKLKEQIEATRELAKFKDQGAAAQAANAQRNQAEIAQASKSFQDLMLGIERSGLNLRGAQSEAARVNEELADKRAFESLQLTGVAYQNRRIARERAALDAKEGLINAEIELEKRRVSETTSDDPARQAKLLDLETKRVAVRIDRLKLEDRIKRGELYTAAPEAVRTQQQFLQFERKAQAELERDAEQRNQRAGAAITELVQINRAGAISLIRDDRARGEAQIALDEEVMRNRLELFAMSGGDRQLAEDALAQWRVQREAQLTEELKPQWQRQLDAWRDTTRLMGESFNDFQAGWLRQGEDAWVQFAQTGKLSIGNLVNFAIAELARLQFRQALAPAWSGLGQSIWGALFGGPTASYSNEGRNYAAPIVASAMGNAFSQSSLVQAFGRGGIMGANGGILTQPTLFPMRNGSLGLGGEAGDEAVMPLRRTASGKLGVISQRGGEGSNVYVTVNNLPGQSASVSKQRNAMGGTDLLIQIKEAVKADMIDDVQNGGRFGSALQNQFGVDRANGLVR